jgi:hypothetical protein
MLDLKITKTRSYADEVNSQFHKSESHYISIPDRLKETIEKDEWRESLVSDAKELFRRRFHSIKQWADFKLCKTILAPLALIDIDTTLQRMFDIEHAANIIDHFKSIMVMPICVYEDAERPGKYICWDGQHTAIVLYIIACEILGEDIANVEVPIVIYPSTMKSEMRECFINLNGEGKKQLDHIDKVHQKVYGVRTDGSNKPEWVLVEQKFQALEKSGIFLTHAKFGDTDKPGAQARLDEFLNESYSVDITEYFGKYFKSICGSNRTVQPKESWMLYEYFRLCKVSKILIDDVYIKAVANSLKISKGDFDSGLLYNKAKTSYQDWFRDNKPTYDGTIWGISYNEHSIGLTFLVAQIAKSMPEGMPVPKYKPHWDIKTSELF